MSLMMAGGGGVPHASRQPDHSHRLLWWGGGGDSGVWICALWHTSGSTSAQTRSTLPSCNLSEASQCWNNCSEGKTHTHASILCICLCRFPLWRYSNDISESSQDCARNCQWSSLPPHIFHPAYCPSRCKAREYTAWWKLQRNTSQHFPLWLPCAFSR